MSSNRKQKKIKKESVIQRASSDSDAIDNRSILRGQKNKVYRVNPQPIFVNKTKKSMVFLLEAKDGSQYIGKFIRLQKQIQVIIEVFYLTKFKGKNICNMIEFFKTSEGFWIVSQKGHTSLYSYMKNLRSQQILVILKNIAIAYLQFYESGIAHRDLKPENIIIEKNLEVKLIDLQLCQKNDQKYGTLNYIPPHLKEIMWASSDSFAYGLIAKQMVQKCEYSDKILQQLIQNCVYSQKKWGWKEIYQFWQLTPNLQNNSNNNNS